MAFLAMLPAIASGVGSLLGGLFGGHQGPQLTSGQKALQNQLTSGASDELTNFPKDFSGYIANSMQGNLANMRSQQNALQRTLAARGLTGSPIGVSSGLALQNAGNAQNQQLVNSLPLLRMQLLQQALSNSSDVFRNSLLGNQQTSALSPGAAIGSGLNAFGSLLAASKFGQNTGGYNPITGNPGFSIPSSAGPTGPGLTIPIGINDPLSSAGLGIDWSGFGGLATPPTFGQDQTAQNPFPF